MDDVKSKLVEAEQKAVELFHAVENAGILVPGKTEKEANEAIFKLADDLFGIKKTGTKESCAPAKTRYSLTTKTRQIS